MPRKLDSMNWKLISERDRPSSRSSTKSYRQDWSKNMRPSTSLSTGINSSLGWSHCNSNSSAASYKSKSYKSSTRGSCGTTRRKPISNIYISRRPKSFRKKSKSPPGLEVYRSRNKRYKCIRMITLTSSNSFS